MTRSIKYSGGGKNKLRKINNSYVFGRWLQRFIALSRQEYCLTDDEVDRKKLHGSCMTIYDRSSRD